ncbi:MAG: hypothetical protein R3B09_33365 [Nannocystaceae bacterium]
MAGPRAPVTALAPSREGTRSARRADVDRGPRPRVLAPRPRAPIELRRGLLALALLLGACTPFAAEPEVTTPTEEAPPTEATAATIGPMIKVSPIDRKAPPPALGGDLVERGEEAPTIVRYRPDPKAWQALAPGLLALRAVVDGEPRIVGVAEQVDADGVVVVPIWLDLHRHGVPLEAGPLAAGTRISAEVGEVLPGDDDGHVALDLGADLGVRVGDVYESVDRSGGGAILRVDAVDPRKARAKVESGTVRAGDWVRRLRPIPRVAAAWIDGFPISAGAREWLAQRVAKVGPEEALHELRGRVAAGAAEDRLPLVALLVAYARWDEASTVARAAVAHAREAGDRKASHAALLVAAQVDLELGAYDSAAAHLAKARGLPSGTIAGMRERLEGELHYRRWDLDRARRELEERALPAHTQAGDRRGEAEVWLRIAEIERHRGDFDRALRLVNDEILPRLKADADRPARARAYELLADVEAMRGPPPPVLAILREQALPLHQALGDRWGEARTQRKIAALEQARGEAAAADRAYEAARAANEATGAEREALRLALWRSDQRYIQSDFRSTAELLRQLLRGYRRLGDPSRYAVILALQAQFESYFGEVGKSLQTLKREALPMAEAIGDKRAIDSVRSSLAIVYAERGMHKEALALRRDQLLPAYAVLADPAEEAVLHLLIADSEIALGQIDAAQRRIARRAKPTLERLGDVRMLALGLDREGTIYEIRGDFPAADRVTAAQRAVYASLGDAQSVAMVDVSRGLTLIRRGDYDGGLRILEKEAIPALQRLGMSPSWASAKLSLAAVLRDRGEYDRALEILKREVIPTFTAAGQRSDVAEAQAIVGDIFYLRGETQRAIAIFEDEVLPVYTATGEVRGRAFTLGRIASCKVQLGKLNPALSLFLDEIAIYESLGDEASAAVAHGEIAGIYELQGKFDLAMRIWVEQVLPVHERSGDRVGAAAARGRIADNHYFKGELDEAIKIREPQIDFYLNAGLEYELMGARWRLALYLKDRDRGHDRILARSHAEKALAGAIRLRVPEETLIRELLQSLPK